MSVAACLPRSIHSMQVHCHVVRTRGKFCCLPHISMAGIVSILHVISQSHAITFTKIIKEIHVFVSVVPAVFGT